ncbi:response regulator [Oceanimonas sp. NS1]|nr:response regulator [Oceanimonas sp. NS1]
MDTGIEVLVIDDDIVTLKLLVGMLNRLEGCMATGCTSARRALARMNGQETSPDMVFLDINMPEMDGFSFIRKLEELGFNGALVLVSGHDQKSCAPRKSCPRPVTSGWRLDWRNRCHSRRCRR